MSAHNQYAVVIVTHDHAETLAACLAAVEGLAPAPARVVVVDNASADGSAEIAEQRAGGLAATIVREDQNTGFAAASNRGIFITSEPWVLLLNPDCAPRPDLVQRLLDAVSNHPEAARIGAVSPKLLRAEGPNIEPQPVIDAAGMVVTCSGRHFDRGAGTDDDGSYDRPAWVFGGTAAAILLRREALDDIAYPDSEFFAESFFAYREDAELAWRLQLRSWRCLYEPSAVAAHRRGFRPEAGRRGHVAINRFSVRNRFLLRRHCADFWWHLRCFPWWLLRDLLVVGACLTVERASLPALGDVRLLRSDSIRRRTWVLGRRTAPPRQIARWFRRRGRVEEVARAVKIAIIGTRGVPANYGGFETFAEELGARLAARGHQVTVYGRRGFIDPQLGEYRGMRLVVLPALRSKHLETVSHTFVAALHAARRGFDVVLMCNAANAPFVRILQLAGVPVALNVDGLERKRRKWGFAGRSYYRLGEYLAARLPNALITDAEVIHRYYRRAYKAASEMIVYGGDLEPPKASDRLAELGLEPGEYLLYVSRFEPENNPDRVVEAYRRVEGSRPLVMVGGAPYARGLTRRVAELADERVLLPGPIYGEGYRQLLFNCRAYIHATEVGGTHPALVEAMGAGRPVLYYDTPENREVAGDVGVRFTFEGERSLEAVIGSVIDDKKRLLEMCRLSSKRVNERYRWSDVADRYEKVLEGLC